MPAETPPTTSATTHAAPTADSNPGPVAGSMTAVVQTAYGSPEEVLELGQVERPTPTAHEVLIRMKATSVNTPDWVTVAGTPSIMRLQAGLRRPKNPVRGTDIAGIVETVGSDVTDFQPGDPVFGSVWESKSGRTEVGTFAEYTVAPASMLAPKPAGIDYEDAAAAVMSGITALVAMRDVGGVGPGTRVLVNGASGGVGTFAVQIAHRLGAEVTGVCSTRNLELVKSLGADNVIDYTRTDLTGGDERFDVILDNVLSHTPKRMSTLLAEGGTLIPNSVGNKGGLLAGLPRMARAALMGLGKTNVKFVRCEVNQATLTAVAELLDSGEVTSVIDEVYPLNEAGTAVAHMLGHHARGNIVITM